MFAATIAVGLVTGGVLFAGVGLKGILGPSTEAPRRAGIDEPMVVALDERGVPIRLDAAGHPIVSATVSPLTAAQPAPTSSAPPPPPPPPPASPVTGTTRWSAPVTTNGAPEAAVVSLANSARADAGCSALTLNDQLTAAARGHSTDMANKDFFAHDSPDGRGVGARVTAAGYTWSMVGENIAKGQNDAKTVMDAWMNSPDHRANILNCKFRNIGVGLATNGKGDKYWTQDFGTPR